MEVGASVTRLSGEEHFRQSSKCKGPEGPGSSEAASRVEGHKQGVSGWSGGWTGIQVS